MPDSYANGLQATGVAKNGAFIGACELVRGGREPKVASLDGGLSPQTQKRIEDGKLLVFVWRVRICCLGIVAAGQQPVSARARFLLTPLCACESLHNWRGRRSQDARLPGFGFESAARMYSNHSSVLTGVSAIERLPDPCCLLPDVCFRRACRQRPSPSTQFNRVPFARKENTIMKKPLVSLNQPCGLHRKTVQHNATATPLIHRKENQ